MLDRAGFHRRFGRKAVFAMVHLGPLPGAPLYAGAVERVIDRALADARTIATAGADGIVVENFGDRPFAKTATDAVVAGITRAVAEIRREVRLHVGVNVLRNDGRAAIAIAAATGAAFVRVNVLSGVMLTDQGLIEGDAAAVLRDRAALAPEIAIFGDWMVKHASPLPGADPEQMARDLRERALADAIVVSGRATGAPVDPSALERLRAIVPDAPLVAGSGVTAANAATIGALADAVIVGSSIKRGGRVDAPVDRRRLERVLAAWK